MSGAVKKPKNREVGCPLFGQPTSHTSVDIEQGYVLTIIIHCHRSNVNVSETPLIIILSYIQKPVSFYRDRHQKPKDTPAP